MKKLIVAVLFSSAALAHEQTPPPAPSPTAKKELVAKVIALQQPAVESLAREIVTRPAMQLAQAAASALLSVAPEKREALGKSIDADIKRFIDESAPILRERALKIAPATLGPILEEKLTEEDLKQVVAWLESATAKKYQQLAGELQQTLGQKLIGEAGPLLEPKLQALQQKVRASLGIPPATGAASSGGGKAIANPKPAAASKAASR